MTSTEGSGSAAETAVVTLIAVPPVPRAEDLALLSVEEIARAQRFAFDRDRSTFVTARAGLRRLLSAACAVSPSDLQIATDADGRPFLLDGHIDADGQVLDFNLSHSGGLAAVGLARGRRIGVDIEWHGRTRSLRDLEGQVMGEQERALLCTLDGRDHTAAFLGYWTRKEAIVKGLGIGISYPLTSIDLPDLQASDVILFDAGAGGVWSVTTTSPLPEYTLSVALAGGTGVPVIRGPSDVTMRAP